MRSKVNEDVLIQSIKESRSKAEALKKVGLVPIGGNYYRVNNLIKKYNINTSHMLGQGWNKGDTSGLLKKLRVSYSMEEVLTLNSTYQSNKLRKRLLSEEIKENKCEDCGNLKWNDKPIPLEVHHSNGDRTDNRIENIKLLCPNCHSQTKTYRGKNKKS